MRKMLGLFIFMLSAALLGGLTIVPLFAQTTYYVSTNGSDVANGTTTSTPWKTLGKINAHAAFQPGDSILIKRGDVFEGQIQVTLNGTASQPIVIGAYGTGAKPIIYGDLRGRTWKAISGYTGYYIAGCEWGGSFAQKSINQYVNGAWYTFPDAASLRNAFPAEWYLFYDGLAEGHSGISTDGDSVIIHTVGSVSLPTSYDSIRTYRYANATTATSSYYIIRDLDLRNFVVGFDGNGDHGIIRNCNTQACINNGINWYLGSTYGLIDSCRMDTTGDTPLYFVEAKYCVARHNLIMNVVDTIHGIATGGVDNAGIGVLDHVSAVAFATPTYGWNTIEYNTMYNTLSGFLDFFYCVGDTFRYNEGHGSTGGAFPHGKQMVISNNNFTMYPTGGNGMNVGQLGDGTTTIAYNTLDSVKDYGIQVGENDGSGTVIVDHNIIRMVIPARAYVNYEGFDRVTSTNNTFYGTGDRWSDGSDYYTLSEFQSAAGHEAGSVWYPSLNAPIGTLIATPDTLPATGGVVTLQWTSLNADSAFIDQGIGKVSLNSSKTLNVTQEKTFTLTLYKGVISTQYSTEVAVETANVTSVEGMLVPITTSLEQNYPNPFNPSTTIRYQLSATGKVRLVVYDIIGREITVLVDGVKGAGYYSERFDGSKLSSGTYFARLENNGNYMIKKIVLMK